MDVLFRIDTDRKVVVAIFTEMIVNGQATMYEAERGLYVAPVSEIIDATQDCPKELIDPMLAYMKHNEKTLKDDFDVLRPTTINHVYDTDRARKLFWTVTKLGTYEGTTAQNLGFWRLGDDIFCSHSVTQKNWCGTVSAGKYQFRSQFEVVRQGLTIRRDYDWDEFKEKCL